MLDVKKLLTKILNRIAPIGTVKYEYLPSNTSVANNTFVKLVEIKLDKGVWVVTGGIRWATNANGYRQLNIYHTSAAAEMHLTQVPISGNWMQMAYTRVIEISADNTPIYLNGRQTSGGALNALGGDAPNYGTYLTAVRIMGGVIHKVLSSICTISGRGWAAC